MTKIVPDDRIEQLVGAQRHPTAHIGRAVSADLTFYILHSAECVASGIDLRDCKFSRALDNGLRPSQWMGLQDRAVFLGAMLGQMVPMPGEPVPVMTQAEIDEAMVEVRAIIDDAKARADA